MFPGVLTAHRKEVLRVITRIEVFSAQADAPELPLGGFAPNSDTVQVRNIDGLGPVKANLSSSPYSTGRGEFFQGSSTGTRNIVLTLGLNPDWVDQTVSSLRRLLYSYFMTEQWVKLRFFMDDHPTVDIEGIVEGCEPNIFSQDPELQVSIICHQPDFVEPDVIQLGGYVPNSLTDGNVTENVLNYEGSVPSGFELKILATEFKPSYSDRIVVVNRSQSFDIDPVEIDADHHFRLVTIKTARAVETVATAESNSLLKHMTSLSKWVEFKPGENIFSIGALESGLAWELRYSNRFGGL
jgi:hypothetical protein